MFWIITGVFMLALAVYEGINIIKYFRDEDYFINKTNNEFQIINKKGYTTIVLISTVIRLISSSIIGGILTIFKNPSSTSGITVASAGIFFSYALLHLNTKHIKIKS